MIDFSTLEQITDEPSKATNTTRPIRRRQLSAASEGIVEDVGSSGPVYNLRSVVAHDGQSPYSGHYVCYAKSDKNAWRVFDDSMVRELPAGQDPTRSLGRKAYILFYVKQGK